MSTVHAGPNGDYIYTADLMRLESRKHAATGPPDHRIAEVRTPLKLKAWKEKLKHHPDKDYVRYILRGIEQGFCIGVEDQRPSFRPASQNMLSAKQHPSVIEEYIQKEVANGNMFGPFTPQGAPKVHINRFGAIPKKYQPGKWRLITDLSYPEGHSINDSIKSELASLTYITVDEIANQAVALGKGALMAKIDIKSAFRLIPVWPQDRQFLGMHWNNLVYIDGVLPFGLRSAPKVFNAVADAIEWCVAHEGVEFLYHYLDDFAILGPPGSEACKQGLLILKRICAELGIPLTPEKEDGPTTIMKLLGIIIDTVRQELRLPEEKLKRLLDLLRTWEAKKSCTRRELESLLGILQHACKVIRPGRAFMRQALSLLSIAKRRHHHIRLNAGFRSDMFWWKAFASHWNGAALIIHQGCKSIDLTSDASGNWGCGAWQGQEWFQLAWDDQTQNLSIAVKELLPIILASIIWGKNWKGTRVVAHCDNMAVVSVLNSRSSKEKNLMQLLRCLFFIEAQLQFSISSIHIPGLRNELADDLSRNRLASFLVKMPSANHTPSPVPPSLMQWLLQPKLDWTSPTWFQQFTSFVPRE